MQRHYNEKTFVVYRGRQPGFYSTWEECQEQVEGFSGAYYRFFPTKEQAVIEWVRYWVRLRACRAQVHGEVRLVIGDGNGDRVTEGSSEGDVVEGLPVVPAMEITAMDCETSTMDGEVSTMDRKRAGFAIFCMICGFLFGVFLVMFLYQLD